jgi:hypothetical protein
MLTFFHLEKEFIRKYNQIHLSNKQKKKTKQNKKNLQIVFGKQTRPRRRGEMENKEIPEEEKAPTIKRPLSRKQKTRQEVRRPT